MNDVISVKNNIHQLYNSLQDRELKSSELLDITDILLQVYTKLDSVNNPEALINRLVNYIRSVSLKGKIKYNAEEEKAMIDLAEFAQKAGLNGLYRGDFSDKSQFYSYFDKEKLIYRD